MGICAPLTGPEHQDSATHTGVTKTRINEYYYEEHAQYLSVWRCFVGRESSTSIVRGLPGTQLPDNHTHGSLSIGSSGFVGFWGLDCGACEGDKRSFRSRGRLSNVQ